MVETNMNCTILNHEYIFMENRPFLGCHASTVLPLQNGDVLAAWFGGTAEAAPDVAIWYARRSEGKWSVPMKVADEEGVAHWNPVLHLNAQGIITLYYKVGRNEMTWYTKIKTSDDNGYTWSESRHLVEEEVGELGPVKNKPIYLADGSLLAPASIEREVENVQVYDSIVDISLDHGQTWSRSAFVPAEHDTFAGEGLIQPALWESEPDQVHMLIRSSEGSIYRSDSTDGGKTWSLAYRTALPNNNSGFDLVKLSNGNIILIYNPVGENWGERTPLVLSQSMDNGETWTQIATLEDRPGEYSYPAIVNVDMVLHMTYTWKRERIVYWEIQLEV